ncbi:MAG: ATP-binding protein [Simkaniaceae bacterium]|nr:MAG: ATP-binding protein [Simkaniaceae bacterium]
MKRTIFDKLFAWKEDQKRKPLIVRGVRQVGKTYILKKFGERYQRCHYINFEKDSKLLKIFEKDLDPKRILDDLSFYLDQSIDIESDLVIFDEIQECPRALTSLKYFQEDLSALHICAAGSLLGIHLSPLSFPVGKVDFLTMRPMSFEEFLMALEDQKSLDILNNLKLKREISELVHEHLWERLKYYMIIGGMPEAVATYCDHKDNMFEAFSMVRGKQEDLVLAYYADMTKHSGKVNAMHIDRIFRAIPTQLEQVQDRSVAKFKFRGVIPGVSHYHRLVNAIDWLEAAGLVIKVHITNSGKLPFKAFSKENAFKLLMFDVGILGSMSGLSPQSILAYDYGTYKGYFAENFVAQELMYAYEEELFSWQERNLELEFLREIKGEVVPFEVKSGSVVKSKSLKIFSEKYKSKSRVVLSGKTLSLNKENPTQYYPLYLAGKFPI